MIYVVPDRKPDPKLRYVVVTDPVEIAAIKFSDLQAPIGGNRWRDKGPVGQWRAEAHSLAQYRGQKVEFVV